MARVSRGTIEAVQNELRIRGYESEYREVEKNKAKLDGLCVWKMPEKPVVVPTIYLNKMVEEPEDNISNINEVVEQIIKTIDKNQMEVDIEKVFSVDVIMGNVKIAVQQAGGAENLISKGTQYDGIDQYLYYVPDEGMSVKLTKEHLERLGIDEQEIWEVASRHTEEDAQLCGLFGMPILSNKSHVRGAASMLFDSVIEKAKEELGLEKIILIPSSIHEVLLFPYEDEEGLEKISSFVKEVNETEVEPEEWLSDRAYVV